jgi:hypothetical protein
MASHHAVNEGDLQYGPTPADAQHEHTDIEPSIATRFAVWLTIAMLISVAIVYGTFWLLEGRELAAGQSTQQFPLAAGQVREPPGPRLQTQPFKDIYMLRQAENEKLRSYGWVDQSAGVVHVPVEDAMRILTERGAIKSAQGSAAGVNQIVEDSSAGRTLAPRY